MNLLIITPYLGATYGGTSESVKQIAQHLGQQGIDVSIITTNANNLEKLEIQLGVWHQEQGYKIQYFPCWHRYDLIFSLPLLQWLLQNIHHYNLVYTHTIFSPLILISHSICQLYRFPYITTPHGMLEPWALSHKAWKKKIYYRLFERQALQNARAIHVLSSVEKMNLQALNLKSQLVHIPNGISLTQFDCLPDPNLFYQRFPITSGKTLILFLGRIDPKKGLDLLAPAFAQVRQHFPQAHLVVAGPDTSGFMPVAKSFFDQAGCSAAVTFTGMLTGEVKFAALAAASIYVAPTYSEGFSMSVLEGMASGLPCVITTGCNFPEAAAAAAALVVEIDADAIATALIECLRDPQAARELGDRAREFIFRNYTWEQSATRLIQAMQTLEVTATSPKR